MTDQDLRQRWPSLARSCTHSRLRRTANTRPLFMTRDASRVMRRPRRGKRRPGYDESSGDGAGLGSRSLASREEPQGPGAAGYIPDAELAGLVAALKEAEAGL